MDVLEETPTPELEHLALFVARLTLALKIVAASLDDIRQAIERPSIAPGELAAGGGACEYNASTVFEEKTNG